MRDDRRKKVVNLFAIVLGLISSIGCSGLPPGSESHVDSNSADSLSGIKFGVLVKRWNASISQPMKVHSNWEKTEETTYQTISLDKKFGLLADAENDQVKSLFVAMFFNVKVTDPPSGNDEFRLIAAHLFDVCTPEWNSSQRKPVHEWFEAFIRQDFPTDKSALSDGADQHTVQEDMFFQVGVGSYGYDLGCEKLSSVGRATRNRRYSSFDSCVRELMENQDPRQTGDRKVIDAYQKACSL